MQLRERPDSGALEIRPIGIAGSITVGTLTLDVVPKYFLGSGNDWFSTILAILERGLRRNYTYLRAAGLARRAGSFVDHLAMAFLDALAVGFSTEVIHVYREVEEESIVLRGRINLPRQLRHITSRPHLLQCDVDRLDARNSYNQLLEWACARFERLVHDAALRVRLQAARQQIPALMRAGSRPSVPGPLPPQYRAWADAVQIAETLLASGTYSPEFGRSTGYGFVLNMERVFERFIEESLRSAVRLMPREAAVRPQYQVRYAVGTTSDTRDFHSRPDDVILVDGQVALVVDAKYKQFGDGSDRAAKPNHPDVYELVAAMTAHGCRRGLLIYPRTIVQDQLDDGVRRSWEVRAFGTTLTVSAAAVDLSKLRGRADLLGFDQDLADLVTDSMAEIP